MKYFLLLLFVAISLNGSSCNKKELTKAYELGAFHTITSIDRNIAIQGIEEESIRFKDYLIVVPIEPLPTFKVLAIIRNAYSEGVTPIITKDKKLILSSKDKKADAQYIADIFNNNYFENEDFRAEVINNKGNKEYKKAVFLYKPIYIKMLNDIKSRVKGKVLIVNKKLSAEEQLEQKELKEKVLKLTFEIEEYKIQNTQKDEEIKSLSTLVKLLQKNKAKPLENLDLKKAKVVSQRVKTATIKDGVSSIILYEDKLSRKYMGKNYKYDDESFMFSKTILNNKQKFKYMNIVVTKDKVEYVKILNKNIYIEVNDLDL